MSTPRNSTPRSSRRRHAAVLAAVLVPVAATIAACSADSVTGPTSAGRGPSQSLAPTPPPPPAPKHTSKDLGNQDTPTEIAALAPTFHTSPADQESGTDRPLNLVCGVNGIYMVSQFIGPNGGTLRFGASSLTIPKGALANTVMISATITLGQGVKVDFAPHGLQFAKAVTINANFAGCTIPDNSALNVYYTNSYGGIVQSMPTATDHTGRVATALTDHFSGYIIAWGRQ